jgi:transcriptional regulator of arginine metabolism
MNGLKERRQQAIMELIRAGALSSQEELAERLSALGFAVTQATISRDLEQIGAVKVRRAGQLSYALPDQVQAASAPRPGLLRDFIRSIDVAVTIVVIKTPPGSAHLIGVALDQSDYAEIVGTICGDDTVFVACSSAQAARHLATKLRSHRSRLQ